MAGEHTVWKGREKKKRKRETRDEQDDISAVLAGPGWGHWLCSRVKTDLALGAVLLLAEILGAADVALGLVAVNLALGALSLRGRGRNR